MSASDLSDRDEYKKSTGEFKRAIERSPVAPED